MSKDPHWLTLARRYIGIAEIKGPQHNTAILDLLDAADGTFGDGRTVQNIRDDETPWCASFVSGVLELAGVPSARSAWARSYLNWGVKLEGAALGAIAVLERGPSSGHVAFVAGVDKAGHLMLLGGNQSDKVSIAPFAPSRVLGYRWPEKEPRPNPRDHAPPVLDSKGQPLSRNEV